MSITPLVIEPAEVLDLLASLVQKSLVVYEEDEQGQGRYRLLETVRQYARDRLLESRGGEAVRERHRDWYLALAEAAGPELWGPRQGEWLDRLQREHDNMRAALDWSGTQGQWEVGSRLGEALWSFWDLHGYYTNARQHLAGLLALPEAKARTPARARVLTRAGQAAESEGDYGAAWALHKEGLSIYRELGDKRSVAFLLVHLGWLACNQGGYGAAQALNEESLAINREVGEREDVAFSLYGLGRVAREQGDCGAARALFEESIAILRGFADKSGIAYSLTGLGSVALNRGEYRAARALFEESLSILREMGEKGELVRDLEGLATLAASQAQLGRAARLFGAAEALREAVGAPLPPADRAEQDRSVAAVRTELGKEAFAAAWAEGRALWLDDAVRYALENADV